MGASAAAPETPPRPGPDQGAGGQEARERLAADRARSARRYLEALPGVEVCRRFRDASGAEHEIGAAPVPGGRFLFDASSNWGLRAIGHCHGGEDLERLAASYAELCAEETEPYCRELRLSDLRRRPAGEGAGGA